MFRSQILYGALLCLCFTNASADSIPADEMMSEQEKNSIGFNKLSSAEKQAFEAWAARWTHHVLDQAPSYRPGQNLTSWIQSWPSFANPKKTEYNPEEIAERQQSNQVIDRNRSNGEYIDLKDGSSWHISPFFRYITSQWKKGQTVSIREGRNQMHPWILDNVSTGQMAEADLGNPPAANGKKSAESADYYEGAIQLQSVTATGDYLYLADGSQWKVAPTDMQKVKNWTPADRIRKEKSNNFLYTYRLTNLDTGEAALANPKK